MGMGGGGGRDKLQSDINVTPLVDVCLVLLIIFMVVTPMLQKGVSVQIPQADNPDKKPESSKQKMISASYQTPPAYYMDTPKPLSKAEFQNALDELSCRLREHHLTPVRRRPDPCREVHVVTHIALIGHKRCACVEAHPDSDRSGREFLDQVSGSRHR